MRVRFQADVDRAGPSSEGAAVFTCALLAHFARYVTGTQSPGIILLPEAIPILAAMEELVPSWSASGSAEWIARLVWNPI